MKRIVFGFLFLVFTSLTIVAQGDKPTLYRQPTMNRTDIAFVYAGDLWKVSRAGGSAVRLTSGTGTETVGPKVRGRS